MKYTGGKRAGLQCEFRSFPHETTLSSHSVNYITERGNFATEKNEIHIEGFKERKE